MDDNINPSCLNCYRYNTIEKTGARICWGVEEDCPEHMGPMHCQSNKLEYRVTETIHLAADLAREKVSIGLRYNSSVADILRDIEAILRKAESKLSEVHNTK